MEFQAVGGTNEPISSVKDIELESSFLIKAELFRSPSKTKRDPLSGDDAEDPCKVDWKGSKYTRTLPTDESDLERITQGVKKGLITKSVSKIETYISEMGEVLDEVSSGTNERLESLENKHLRGELLALQKNLN